MALLQPSFFGPVRYRAIKAGRLVLGRCVDAKGKGFTLSRSGLGDTPGFTDNYHVVTTSMTGIATVWDVRTGQKSQHIDAPANGVDAISLAWSPVSRDLVTGKRDGSILILNLDGEQPGEMEFLLSHVGRVNDRIFSDDGKYMASAAHDKTVVIWDMETRKEVSRHVSNGDISDLEAIWKFLSEDEVIKLEEDKAIGQWLGTSAIYALQVGLSVTGHSSDTEE